MSEETPRPQNEHLRISNLIFASGSQTNEENYDVECGNIVILVGPNNSGKSTVLKEIENYCSGGDQQLRVLSDMRFNIPLSEQGINELLNAYRVEPIPENQNIHDNEILLSIPDVKGQSEEPQYQRASPELIRNAMRGQTIERRFMNKQVIRFFTIRLDGETRFDLIKNKPRGNLKVHSSNSLSKVFRDKQIHEDIDKIIHDEFNWHFYLDSTGPQGQLEIVFNSDEFENWKSQDDSSVEFFSTSTSITNVGDGIKIFTGLLIAAMSLPHKIFLVDEPEAFLHPPKARSLGGHLTKLIQKRDASLIISTHSPDFVLGCLDESKQVTIIRLTYSNNIGTTTHLNSEQVSQLVTDPLLRTTDTFNALFHDSAVITEDHTDRVFYKEIFDKYKVEMQNPLLEKTNRGTEVSNKVNDIVFLNTNGKHRIHRIFGPLRKIGIPTAAIYDLDVIKHESMDNAEGTLWKTILRHANVPNSEIDRLESERACLEEDLSDVKETDMIPFKRKGLEHLEDSKKGKGEHLLSELQKYGIFIIPTGELESWSSDILTEEPRKSYWLENILQEIDNDEKILPGKKIWKFMKELNVWLTNSTRLGMFS